MLRFKKKVIWRKLRPHRPSKVATRLTKIQLFRNICKSLRCSSFMTTNSPVQTAPSSFKSILLRLQKFPALPRRPLNRQVPVKAVTTNKSTPAIIYKLCRALQVDYKTIEGNRLLREYTDFYISSSKNKLVEKPLLADQAVANTTKAVKIEPLIVKGTTNTDANKKSLNFRAGQHSKNWIDPKIWRKMPQRERDEFLIKTGKRQRKQEDAK